MFEYEIVGRRVPTEREENPTIYRMTVFAKSEVIARSRFWYFMKRQNRTKRTKGEVLDCKMIVEEGAIRAKNYGIWLRYDSRSGVHNMYKEYRALTRSKAVTSMIDDMAGRHRAQSRTIQVVKIAEVPVSKARRPGILEYAKQDLKFPVTRNYARAANKQHRKVFESHKPNLFR